MIARLFDQKWIQRVIVWGLLLVAWDTLAVRYGPIFLPRVGDVAASFIASITNGDLGMLIGSMQHLAIGFLLASIIGVGLGLLMGSSPLVDALLGLYARALFVTTLEALLPFLIILFGTQLNFRIVVVFLFSVFHILFNTAAGVRSVTTNLREMAEAFCTPRPKYILGIIFPHALPYIVTGLRIGLGHAFKGMIIAELWIVVGSGKILIELGAEHQLAEYFAVAMWIILFGVVLNRTLLMLQRRFLRWQINPFTQLNEQ